MTNETNQTKVLMAQYEDTNNLQEAHYIHKQNKFNCKKTMIQEKGKKKNWKMEKNGKMKTEVWDQVRYLE